MGFNEVQQLLKKGYKKDSKEVQDAIQKLRKQKQKSKKQKKQKKQIEHKYCLRVMFKRYNEVWCIEECSDVLYMCEMYILMDEGDYTAEDYIKTRKKDNYSEQFATQIRKIWADNIEYIEGRYPEEIAYRNGKTNKCHIL